MDQHSREKITNILLLAREEIAMKQQILEGVQNGHCSFADFGTSEEELTAGLAKAMQDEEHCSTILASAREKVAQIPTPNELPKFDRKFDRKAAESRVENLFCYLQKEHPGVRTAHEDILAPFRGHRVRISFQNRDGNQQEITEEDFDYKDARIRAYLRVFQATILGENCCMEDFATGIPTLLKSDNSKKG